MILSPFNPAQCRAYFEARLPGYHFNGRAQNSGHCPFHSDSNGSFSFNVDSGCWMCHAGCGSGNLLDYEQKYSNCDRETAKTNLAALLPGVSFRSEPEAVYLYRDPLGRVVFRKLRWPGKKFVCEAPAANGKDWVKNLSGIRTKPLYNLPQLIRSSYAIICEGEKDCDRLTAVDLSQFDSDGLSVAVTTNFDGADGCWRQEYNPYFAGRQVTIFPDNDVPGEKHALDVARGIFPFAAGLKICRLPGLPEKGDVSDFLDAGHTVEELIAEIAKTPVWQSAAAESDDFTSMIEIVSMGAKESEWVIGRHVERTGITALSAKIKCGKSSLAMSAVRTNLEGTSFLGYPSLHGPVVMVSEMSGNAFLSALRRAGLQNQEGLWVMQPHQLFGKSWEEIVQAAVQKCKAVSAVLLVIDTIAWAAGLTENQENDAGIWREVYRPLQAALWLRIRHLDDFA